MSGGGGGLMLPPVEPPRRSSTGLRAYNVLLVGQSGSGKTCLAFRAADRALPLHSHITTIGVDYRRITVDLQEDGSEQVMLQLWDASGHERFGNIIAPYYKTCNGVVVVYDVTDKRSFAYVSSFFQRRIKEQVSAEAAVLLLGTKIDRAPEERGVSEEEGRSLASSLGWAFIETSASTGQGVATAFQALAREMVRRELEGRAKEKEAMQTRGAGLMSEGDLTRSGADGQQSGGCWSWLVSRTVGCCCLLPADEDDDQVEDEDNNDDDVGGVEEAARGSTDSRSKPVIKQQPGLDNDDITVSKKADAA